MTKLQKECRKGYMADIQWLTIRDAARLADMKYERFRWWVDQGRGPARHAVLNRLAFDAAEVKAWKPAYRPRGGYRPRKAKP